MPGANPKISSYAPAAVSTFPNPIRSPPTAEPPAVIRIPVPNENNRHRHGISVIESPNTKQDAAFRPSAAHGSVGQAGAESNALSARYSDAFAAFESPDSAWRTLTSFAIYRLLIVVVLAIIYWGFTRFPIFGGMSPIVTAVTLVAYIVLSCALVLATQVRVPSAAVQLTLQVLVDIAMLTLLMYASGGTRSGMGLMLLVSLAAAALVSRGRMAFFHAAIAALAVLFEQSWQLLYNEGSAADYVPSGMLSGSFFVVAALGYTLAQYARGAAQVAERRGVDLANLAQINELVIRDMQDGFVVIDELGVIRQHNRQSEALVAGLRGASGKALGEVAPILSMLVNEWRMDRTRMYSIVRDQATQREYQMRCVAIGEADNAPTVVFLEDASRIRSQAQQMKLVALGRLTASIAHEIRNPLSSINHAAELLEEDTARNDADKRLLTIIQENAHRLDRIVEEVLYLNRRDRAQPEMIDLRDYLARFLREFSANEKYPVARFTVDVDDQLSIFFDRAHLDQVLWNLVRNAARHGSSNEGAVILAAHDLGDRIHLDVRDDGPGVAIESLPHLFEPFFTTDTKGTGLGLYIARELAEVNGAGLEYVVDNERAPSLITGACFRLNMKKSGSA